MCNNLDSIPVQTVQFITSVETAKGASSSWTWKQETLNPEIAMLQNW